VGAEDRDDVEARVRELLDREAFHEAATAAIRGYGPKILGYLRAVLREEDAAAEAYARFGEALWKGMRRFRGEASLKTWCYRLAWGEVLRLRRDPYRRRARRLESSQAERLAAVLRESTVPFKRTAAKDAVARLRGTLAPDEQTLLILRVNQNLAWKDVAQVFAERGQPADEAALRKRFERITERLRKLAAAEGLVGPR
jgi:RNA polymerase sigma-70 factor (ECF subfamily)